MQIKYSFVFSAILLSSWCLLPSTATVYADNLRDANRLLRVTNLGNRFELTALDQTRKIIRTYTSIVNMNASVALPQRIKNSIAECYAEVYQWDHFKPGIAQIIADNLSQKEILLLIDFYSDRGLPPMEIETFKNTIAKADLIESSSIDYIFDNSGSCVEKDAALISEFLGTRNIDSPDIVHFE